MLAYTPASATTSTREQITSAPLHIVYPFRITFLLRSQWLYIPPIGNFNEKDEAEAGGEYFKDQIVQFEPKVSAWDDWTKLVDYKAKGLSICYLNVMQHSTMKCFMNELKRVYSNALASSPK